MSVVLKFKTLSRKKEYTRVIECRYRTYALGFVKREVYNYFQERLHMVVLLYLWGTTRDYNAPAYCYMIQNPHTIHYP